MAIKNYMINDKWLDIDKQNIVEVKSTDGVIGSVKLNGEEYGGGGGSSDFSTATLTITGTNRGFINVANVLVVPDYNLEGTNYQSALTDDALTVILYKGKAYAVAGSTVQSVSGNITYDSDMEWYVITGDCTVNFS